ncbi:ABC transporter permease [Synechococcus sp. PCC 7336]|uniref:ABC transporter permease n=1 Tax=Synechococcus sp. PCC 7336 TaxID=195250 RepID=UPI000346DCB5|nr:ABC transporter permease [Synechococcus sp. PCC 7336]
MKILGLQHRSSWMNAGLVVGLVGFSILLLLAMLWPLVYVFWISFTPSNFLRPPVREWSLRWYQSFFQNPQWTMGLKNSLIVAAMTVFGSLASGGCSALAVTRFHFRGAKLLSGALLLPLFVPAVVLAMALLPFVHKLGIWGSHFSLAAAHSLWSVPVVFLVIRSALEDLNPDLEAAARGLGASPLASFRRVTLPLIAPAVMVGATMAFILSLNEVVVALFLSTPAIETLPKVIWPNLLYTLTPLVAAASSITMALTLGGMAIATWLFRLWQQAKRR